MVFKHFRIQCLIRVILLGCSLLLFTYLVLQTCLYATLVLIGALILYQTISLIRYVEITNRQLIRFMQSIEYADLSQTFTGRRLGASFDELYRTFTEVTNAFRKLRAEREEQYRYLQTVVQHVGVGVIAYQPNGDVEIINTAARRLLNTGPSIHNLSALRPANDSLVDRLLHMKPGERPLEKVGESQLSLHATEFKMQDRHLKLVSIQNIQSELEEKEMEAWQNLVRVLTHEIMNSVTPISSLANTVEDELKIQLDREVPDLKKEEIDDLHLAIQTIKKRSAGLIRFVQEFRNLTHIPKPKLNHLSVREMIDQILMLLKTEINSENIKVTTAVEPADLSINADKELIEQVMINLLKNAIQAFDDHTNKLVEVNGFINDKNRPVIAVRDNGAGIDEEALHKIFIPFFTTKKHGSGIGLDRGSEIGTPRRGGPTTAQW